jgi:hypothetical protein
VLLRTLVIVAVVLALAGLAAYVLSARRRRHEEGLADLWRRLRETPGGGRFDAASIADLRVSARRYLEHAIAPGTVLDGSVELEMEGRIGLSPGAEKTPFRARQLLAVPGGLIWQAEVGRGLCKVTGSDSYGDRVGEMLWFLWQAIPVVRGSGPDVTLSAAGRVAVEAALLLPSALHPSFGACWEAGDDRVATVHLKVGELDLSPTLHVDPNRRLLRIEMMRWEPSGPSGAPEEVRWVVEGFDETAEAIFGGYTLPTTVRVTKNAGTPQVDTFFEARILSAKYQ